MTPPDLLGPVGSKVGTVFHEKSFTSTSADEAIAEGSFSSQDPGSALVHIIVPAGVKVIKPGSLAYRKEEKELILDRGASFRIDHDEVDDRGQRHVYLTQLQPGDSEEPEAASSILSSPFSSSSFTSYSKHSSPVTWQEKSAIDDYTLPEIANSLNNGLRKGSSIPEDEELRKDLDSLMTKSTAAGDIVAYRGFAADPGKPFKVGDEFTDDGFTSTSLSQKWASEWASQTAGSKSGSVPVVMQVVIPEGSHMTTGTDSAKELILDRGSKFKVVKADKSLITVEVSQPRHEKAVPASTPSETASSGALMTSGMPTLTQTQTPATTAATAAPQAEVTSSVIPGSANPVKPPPIADDPPAWLQDAHNAATALDDEIEKERSPSGHFGFTPRGEELRREQSRILSGDPWVADDDSNRYGAYDRARQEGIPEGIQRRAGLLATNKLHRAHLSAESGLTPEEGDRQMTDELKRELAGRRVAIRVTNGNLAKILDDGSFKTQFETNRSKALKSNDARAKLEAAQFGYPDDLDPSLRPIYAYMDEGYDRPAGSGTKFIGDFGTDDLSMFGTTQVILNDDVRDRSTFNIGDSMDNQYSSLPSRVSDPKPHSYAAFGKKDGGMVNPGVLKSMNRDYSGGKFRSQSFIEAQVHSPDGSRRPLMTSDIHHVVFPSTPPAALRDQLSAKGISWTVTNARTVAKSGSAEDKARVLSIYQGDLAQANARLEWLQSYGDEYRQKYGKEWSGLEDVPGIQKKTDEIQASIRLLESAGA
jgi:hypothetical protein